MAAGTPPVCPWLGLVDDPATHFAFPSVAQLCHATERPSAIDATKQARDCLTQEHLGCLRYRPITAPAPRTEAHVEPHLRGVRSRLIRLALLIVLTGVVVALGFIAGIRLGSAL